MDTVYVDRLRDVQPSKRWPYDRAAHLYTTPDNLPALHQFAARLGLKHSWFQRGNVLAHYDLTEGKREEALAMGAVEASYEVQRDVFRQWYERRHQKKKGKA